MNSLPDYTYVDRRGRGCVTIRPVGTLAQDPAQALQLSRVLDELLLLFTNDSPQSAYLLLGVLMPAPEARADYGPATLLAAVTELKELPVWPCNYTFVAAPPTPVGVPRGQSIWMIGWPQEPTFELPVILRTLEGYGLLTAVTFRRNDREIWLMANLPQAQLRRALKVVQ